MSGMSHCKNLLVNAACFVFNKTFDAADYLFFPDETMDFFLETVHAASNLKKHKITVFAAAGTLSSAAGAWFADAQGAALGALASSAVFFLWQVLEDASNLKNNIAEKRLDKLIEYRIENSAVEEFPQIFVIHFTASQIDFEKRIFKIGKLADIILEEKEEIKNLAFQELHILVHHEAGEILSAVLDAAHQILFNSQNLKIQNKAFDILEKIIQKPLLLQDNFEKTVLMFRQISVNSKIPILLRKKAYKKLYNICRFNGENQKCQDWIISIFKDISRRQNCRELVFCDLFAKIFKREYTGREVFKVSGPFLKSL